VDIYVPPKERLSISLELNLNYSEARLVPKKLKQIEFYCLRKCGKNEKNKNEIIHKNHCFYKDKFQNPSDEKSINFIKGKNVCNYGSRIYSLTTDQSQDFLKGNYESYNMTHII